VSTVILLERLIEVVHGVADCSVPTNANVNNNELKSIEGLLYATTLARYVNVLSYGLCMTLRGNVSTPL
jgi:hypothetical protein